MRPFVYLILLVLAVIVFKAFYFDSWQAEKRSETNASAETVQAEKVETPPPATQPEFNISGMGAEKKVKPKPEYSGMPLEKVGDEIADKLEGKF